MELPGRPDLTELKGLLSGLEETVAGMAQAQRKIARLTGEAWSKDGMVHAVVGPRGHLVELDLDPRVFRRPDSAHLSAEIVATVRDAIASVSAKARDLMDRAVPADLRPKEYAGFDLMETFGMHDADVLARRPPDD
jgi:DNA-binding protein YbaB